MANESEEPRKPEIVEMDMWGGQGSTEDDIVEVACVMMFAITVGITAGAAVLLLMMLIGAFA